jgi:hypothetical protein
MSWEERFKKQSQMEVDFAPLGKLPRPAPIIPDVRTRSRVTIGSDFQDARERHFVPGPFAPYIPKGATRYPDYDPFGSEFARQSTDLPADVQDYLPGDPARNLKLKTSSDDFSGVGSFGGFGFGAELGPFGSGKVSALTVSPLEMVGPPPAYHAPPGPGMGGRVVIGADVAPKAPLWAKFLGGIGVFLGGIMAERYIDKRLNQSSHKRSKRSR